MEVIKHCSINWATSEVLLLSDACLSTLLEIKNEAPCEEKPVSSETVSKAFISAKLMTLVFVMAEENNRS